MGIRIASARTPEFWNDTSSALAYLTDVSASAGSLGVSLLAFPEAYLQGYVIEERHARQIAIDLASPAFADILSSFPAAGPMIVVGLIEIENNRLFNTAIAVKQRELIGRYRKRHLLKSERAFQPGNDCPIFETDGLKFGVNICYDTNFPGASQDVARAGGSLLVCCANNMLPRSRAETFKNRHNAERGKRCRETGLWMLSSDITGERNSSFIHNQGDNID